MSTNSLREAAQQALYYLDAPSEKLWPVFTLTHIIDALRAALAEPVQEPVAWRIFDGEGGYDYQTYDDNEDYAAEFAKRNPRYVGWVEPLYTAPPQRNPQAEGKPWRCACGANLYIDENGAPRSKA